jgi:RHH-type proline utilization regulon transcriptional repressor/proline dehydrogenase/delta 1-pyrroline-5-carboxylate dehydrogenase
VGQVAAALAAGNVVLAKPAEQTPLIAAEAVRACGRPACPGALQLLPGRGETVGARLVGDARHGRDVHRLHRSRAPAAAHAGRAAGRRGHPVPLIAETGGQNAMIVDSSALAEQVVGDDVSSAFDSAGQRCSPCACCACRRKWPTACVTMLQGRHGELRLGNPRACAPTWAR